MKSDHKKRSPERLSNELPQGYIRRDGIVYKVLENGSEIAVAWEKLDVKEVLRSNDGASPPLSIETLNKAFRELGIDYQHDTRKIITTYVVINEVGSDIGDEVWGVYDTREEAEIDGKVLYRSRIEEHIMRRSVLTSGEV